MSLLSHFRLSHAAGLACVLGACFASGGVAQDSPWKKAAVPDVWKNPPDGENILQWYRCLVKVPEAWKGKDVLLVVEAADDAREFYVGGEKVGSFGDFPPKYRSGLGGTKQFKIDP